MITRCLMLMFIAFGAAVAAEGYRETEAVIYKKDGSTETGVFVKTESVKEIIWTTDPAVGFATMAYSDVDRVEYPKVLDDLALARGLGALRRKKYEKAEEEFKKAAKTNIQSKQIKGLEYLSTTYAEMKEFEKAAKVLGILLKRHPLWPHALDIQYKQAELLMQAEKLDDANALFVALESKKGDFGPVAVAQSYQGQAIVATAKGENAQAVELLIKGRDAISVDESPSLYGLMGLAIAKAYGAEGKNDDALTILKEIAYVPLNDYGLQADVHVDLGMLYFDKNDLRLAFDHAAKAAVLASGEDAAVSSSRRLMNKTNRAIKDAEDFTAEEKVAYQKITDSL